jgi:polyferredoxin
VSHRPLLEVDVLRDRNALYRQVDDATLENVYTIRFLNKDERAHTLHVAVEGLPDARIDTDNVAPVVESGEVLSMAVRVRVPSGTVQGGRDIRVVVTADDDGRIRTTAKARFIAPVTP